MCDQAPRIALLCVDDHRLVREGIAALISRQPDMVVVGLAASAEEAIALFRSCHPDVTLMDLQMPRMSGLDAIRTIRREDADAKIIVITMHRGEEDVYQALAAGASTYVLKDALPDDLVDVIRQIHAGKRPVTVEVEACLLERSTHTALSVRELQIVELIAQGMRNKEIAAALGIAQETVHVHLRKVFTKLQVNDRTAVIAVALRRGIIHIR